jgi:hypothetical protein
MDVLKAVKFFNNKTMEKESVITDVDLREIDAAMENRTIPPECRECKNKKPENCNTCPVLNPQFDGV